MNRRYVLVGALLLVALASAGTLALYTPTDATASAPSTPAELDGSYTVSETVSVDGDVFVSRESIVDAETGDQRQHIVYEGIEYDHYWAADGERYTKATAETPDRLDDWLEETDDDVLQLSDDERSAVGIAPEDAATDDGPADYAYPDGLVHSQLELTAFAETGSTTVDGTTLETYEPEAGWIEIDDESMASGTQRVTDAGGEVHVGSNGQLHHANVTLERVDAETWGEYLVDRGDAWTTTVEYDVRDAAEDVRPEWVDDVQRDAGSEFE